MSNNHATVSDDRDFFVRQLAAAEERDRLHRCIVPILDCIRKMRVGGLADNEIAGLFRHAADELEGATTTVDAAAVHTAAYERGCATMRERWLKY